MPRRRVRTSLAEKTIEALRERIFAAEPGTRIGALHALARSLGVGIVTLQQAARVLEYEGLLEVRRGPGGGYYGVRPGDAAFERALESFMRMNPTSFEEALDMTSLLFTELATAAAGCTNEMLRDQLAELARTLDASNDRLSFGAFEERFQELLFQMVQRPLFELLTRVTLHYAASQQTRIVQSIEDASNEWRDGRRRIICAIIASDAELTRFEAVRHNRAIVLATLNDERRLGA